MTGTTSASASDTALVCHCCLVTYAAVDAVLAAGGAGSLADIQAQTGACTRCFGCRFELERMLELKLGDAYRRSAFVTRLPDGAARKHTALPRRMYIPVLTGYRDYDIATRVIMFNSADAATGATTAPVHVRADLLALDGTRVDVREALLRPGTSVVLDAGGFATGLAEGVGVLKLVVDAAELGSLRPYFHLVSPGGITSTHEKAGAGKPSSFGPRGAHWIFPIGFSPALEEAYFFATNTQEQPMEDQELVWQSESGDTRRIAVPRLELDQSVCVALHDYVPAISRGTEAGSVRLEPAAHKIAGFMIRHDREGDLWRIQHL